VSVFELAAAAAASAISAGLAVVTATVLALRSLQPLQPASAVVAKAAAANPDFGFFYFLIFGTIAGILVAGIVAWTLLGPIGSTYRRGGLALVCAFATVLCMLVSMPVDRRFGKTGLATLLAISGAAAAGFAWRARRATIV
jgi:hypothetical protein